MADPAINSANDEHDTSVHLRIEYEGGKPAGFSNHFTLQSNQDGFFLSFFQICPPLVIRGNGPQFEDLEAIDAHLIAKVLVSNEKLQAISNVICEALNRGNEQL